VLTGQGLLDLGVGAATLRYSADAAARGSRSEVVSIFLRSGAFYIGLALVVGVPMLVLAPALADLLPSLPRGDRADAALLIRYVALALIALNAVVLLSSLLQALNRVATAFRSTTIGWLLYVPIMAGGLQLGWGVDAAGIAWLGTFTITAAILAVHCWGALREVPDGPGSPPSSRDILALGGKWQLSAWADFATFQLPRLLTGFLLSAHAVVAVDLALRGAQIFVLPLFAIYPVVLPTVARLHAQGEGASVRSFATAWAGRGLPIVVLATAAFLALEIPALAVWTGQPVQSFDLLLVGAVLIGTVAHACTGFFSSSLLALGELRPILRYKTGQLVLAAVTLPTAAALGGSLAVGLALSTALFVPAAAFVLDCSRRLQIRFPHDYAIWLRRVLVIGGCLTAGVPLAVQGRFSDSLEPVLQLALLTPLCLGIFLAGLSWSWRRSRVLTGAGLGTV